MRPPTIAELLFYWSFYWRLIKRAATFLLSYAMPILERNGFKRSWI